MKADAGKWVEKQVQGWLESASTQAHDFAWHRYPDARAARGALAAQPADFLVSCGTAFHLEAKETKEVKRLPKAKVRQYGMLKKFHWAGITPFVVIYRSECNDWVYLGPAQLFEFDECPPSFDLSKRPSYTSCSAIMEWLFNETH